MIHISQLESFNYFKYQNELIEVFIYNSHGTLLQTTKTALNLIIENLFNKLEENKRNNTFVYFLFLGIYIFFSMIQAVIGHMLNKLTNVEEKLLLSIPIKDCLKLQADANEFLNNSKVTFVKVLESISKLRK